MKKSVLLFLFVILIPSIVSASLGLTPAKMVFDFEPGKIIDLNYKVFSDNPDVDIQLYSEGDLAQYVTINKEIVHAGDSFNVRIGLPQALSSPGENKIFIGARELQDSEGTIGSLVNIRALVVVFAPYPGKYVEASLYVSDGNIGQDANVELNLINRGEEVVSVDPRVDFYDPEGFIEGFNFNSVYLNLNDRKTLEGTLSTEGYKPGTYFAEATLNYGEQDYVNTTFRIGSLFVNITNFTTNLQKGGIQKFFVNVESLWNDDLDEVYADVNLSNGVQEQIARTPSVSLDAWEKKTLEGFIDTSELEGEYNVQIELTYSGEKSFASGKVKISRGGKLLFIVVGVIALLIILGFAWFFVRKRRK